MSKAIEKKGQESKAETKPDKTGAPVEEKATGTLVRKCSPAVVEGVIRFFEGYHKPVKGGGCEAYPDPGSDDGRPWTIGFGTTEYKGPGLKKFGRPEVKPGDQLSRAEAEAEFDFDIEKFEAGCNEKCKDYGLDLNQNQFDAFVSFSLNAGYPSYDEQGKAESQMARLEKKDLDGFGKALNLYIRGANGKILPGLVTRRKVESDLFFRPVGPEAVDKGKPNQLKYAPLPLPWVTTDPLLKLGDQSDDVFELNCALMGLGFLGKSELVPDYFSEHTAHAVARLQKTRSLVQTGQVDKITKDAIVGLLAAARDGDKIKAPIGMSYFSQYENRYEPSGTCGLTSAAMLLSAHGITRTPDSLYLQFGKGQGQSPGGLEGLYKSFGLRATSSYQARLSAIGEALRRGYPVIVHGFFTRSGHIVCLRSQESQGYVVNDPAGDWSRVVRGGYAGRSTDGSAKMYLNDEILAAIGRSGSIWASTAWKPGQDAIDLTGAK